MGSVASGWSPPGDTILESCFLEPARPARVVVPRPSRSPRCRSSCWGKRRIKPRNTLTRSKARDILPGFFISSQLMTSSSAVLDSDLAVMPRLDHLRALEAESIHILRELVAEF